MCEIDNDHFTYDFQSTVSGWVAMILAEKGAKKILPGETIAVLAEEKEEIPAVVEMIQKEIKAGTLRIYTAPSVAPPAPAVSDASKAAEQGKGESKSQTTPSDAASSTTVAASADQPQQVIEVEDEVVIFLRTIHVELVSYSAVLKADGFDSIDAIDTLKETDLEKLGVKTGHRRILINYLEKRRAKNEGKEEAKPAATATTT